MTDKVLVLDVAIIGAGIAGVYAGWRLATKQNNCRVAIFEASDRVGGRLYSVTPPGSPGVKLELGGRRILPAKEQPRIHFLIETLNQDAPEEQRIETYELPSESSPEGIAYVRGTHLRQKNFSQDTGCEGSGCVPFRTKFSAQGRTPDELMRKALERIVPGITNPNLSPSQRRAMTRDATFDGQPLYMQGFAQVLVRVLGNEGYQFVLSSGGYEEPLTQGNAADAVATFPAHLGAQYRGFKQGFQQVPLVLAERFQQHGGEIHFNMPLEGFDWKDGVAELRFQGKPPVKAKAVVLAVPPQVLKRIALPTPTLRAGEAMKWLETVAPMEKGVVHQAYDSVWWKEQSKEGLADDSGPRTAVSDLMVGKVSYPSARVAPLHARDEVYAEKVVTTYFKEKSNVRDFDSGEDDWVRPSNAGGASRPGRFVGFRERVGQRLEVDSAWLDNAPSEALVEAVQRDLREIHGEEDIPAPKEAVAKVWPEGRGCWLPRVKSQEASEQSLQPYAGAPIYNINSDFSVMQGTAEGGLMMADKMLEKVYSIRPLVEDEER